MENVAYVALSRQLTLRRELEVTANNVANVDTVGFKLEQLLVSAEPGARARNDGVRAPLQYAWDQGVGRDYRQGELRRTGAPFDFAVEGDGFFQVRTDQGERFTRDGRFAADPQGRLVTQQGWPVLDDAGAEIVLNPEAGEPSVSADGVITQNGVRAGKIGLFRFEALGALAKTGDGLFENASNIAAEPATEARVRQGALEGSNVKPIVEITKLIEITRAYERVSKIIEQSSDLSRRSIERLGRVS